MTRALAVLILGLLITAPCGALAQTLGPAQGISILLNPQYPRPNQLISITVKSTAIDLTASTVVISVNGTEVERGTGVVTAQARVGGAGQTTTIAVAVTNNGQTYRTQASVRPADVALIVEPLTTAHPFYMGSPLVASEGRLRVVAIPDIRTGAGRVAAPNLVYTWKLGSQILQSSSGIGRSTLTATAPVRYRSANVSVTVTTQDQSIVAYAEAAIAPVDPVVRVYENDPLLGPLFNRALTGSVAMEGEEETFRAVPYHFANSPSLSWLLNSVATGVNRDITVRSTGAGAGSALLSLSARGGSLFQTADASLSVRFGEDRPLGIFGL